MSITLSVYTLGSPSGYKIDYVLPSRVFKAANGRGLAFAAAETALREFTVRWENNLAGNDRYYLIQAFYNLCNVASTFIDPAGDTYSVIRHPDQEKINLKLVRGSGSGDYLWTAELKMIEAI